MNNNKNSNRTWFLVYDIQYANSLRKAKWWTLINSEMCSKSFWIKNKNKIGSFNYFIRFFVAWAILWFTIMALLPVAGFDRNKWVVFNAVHAFLAAIGTFIVWTRLPKGIYDVFYIRREIRAFLIFWAIIVASQIVMGAAGVRDTAIGWEISSLSTWYVFFCKLSRLEETCTRCK